MCGRLRDADMKQGDLRGVDSKICISPQDPHVLLGRNTRVRLNISSFVSCDVLGLAPTPLPHTDSARGTPTSAYNDSCCFSKRLACIRLAREDRTTLFFELASRTCMSQSVAGRALRVASDVTKSNVIRSEL